MRKFALFIVAFLVALASMPLVFGLLTKHKVKKLADTTQTPDGIFLSLEKYDMGYLSSDAVMTVMIVDPNQFNQPAEMARQAISFNLNLHINHGPFFSTSEHTLTTGLAHAYAFLLADNLNLGNAELEQTLREVFGPNPIISMDTTVGLTGAIDALVSASPINVQANDGTLSWGGLEGKFYLAGNSNVMQASFDIDPLLLQADNNSTLDFSRITFLSQAKRDNNMPWTGEQTLSLPAFYMRDENGQEVRLTNLLISANSDIKNQLAQVTVNAKADGLQYFGQEMKDTKLDVALNRLTANSLVEFSKITQRNQKQLSTEEQQQLSRILIEMLSAGATFDLNYFIDMEEGDINAKIAIAFPNLSSEIGKEPFETIAQKLIMQVNAMLSFTTPKTWLEDSLYRLALSNLPDNAPSQTDPKTGKKITPQEALKKDIQDQINTLSQAGVLVEDQSNLAFQLNYQQGNIILNGNSLTQEDINQLMKLISPDESKKTTQPPAAQTDKPATP